MNNQTKDRHRAWCAGWDAELPCLLKGYLLLILSMVNIWESL